MMKAMQVFPELLDVTMGGLIALVVLRKDRPCQDWYSCMWIASHACWSLDAEVAIHGCTRPDMAYPS